MRARFRLLLLALALIGSSTAALAAELDEAGIDGDAADDAAPDAGTEASDEASNDDGSSDDGWTGPSNQVPLRCDGDLCDTTTGSTTCSIAGGFGIERKGTPVSGIAFLAVMGLAMARRRAGRSRVRPVVTAALLSAFAMHRAASAQSRAEPPATQAGPVDVAIHEPAPPRRFATVEWNPLPFLAMHTGVRPSDPGRPAQGGLGKLSANIVLAPFEHHAIIVSPFYVLTRTTPITIFDDDSNPTRLPIQTFRGYGTELGYRYYSGRGGLRGFFAGPSLILGSFTATAENGNETPYVNYGVAVDIGYQALIVDKVALSLGTGLQYTTTNKSLPEQMIWARVFANTAVFPRVLISVGWAL